MHSPYERFIVGAMKRYALENGMTQADLARKLGWSPADLSGVLRGKKPVGKIRQKHIAQRLGVKLDYGGDMGQKEFIYSPEVRRLADMLEIALREAKKDFRIAKDVITRLCEETVRSKKRG